MSDTSQPDVPCNPDPRGEVDQGLIDFYSGLATAALAQYDSIHRLLGTTTDWSGPGMECETLIRQLVRNALPGKFSVDKGFIHGRRAVDGKTVHSPEVDVLIHNAHDFAPLHRVQEFVVVHPDAVHGIIQVKRTMTSGALKTAMTNVVEAKRHVRECRRSNAAVSQLEFVFSAVVTFRDDIAPPASGEISKTYENQIKEYFAEWRDGYTLPQFVGSLDKYAIVFNGLNVNKMNYSIYDSSHNDRHFGLQVFLATMVSTIMQGRTQRQFAFPKDYTNRGRFFHVFESPAITDEVVSCASSVESAKPSEPE